MKWLHLCILIVMLTSTSFANGSQANLGINSKADAKLAAKNLKQQFTSWKQKQHFAEQVIPYDLELADDWIELALKQVSEEPQLHFTRAIINSKLASESFLMAFSYANTALESFQKAVELAPNTIRYRKGLMRYYYRAPAIAGGDKELALAQASEIERLDQRQGLIARLEVLQVDEEYSQMKLSVNRGIALYPELPDFYFWKGLLEQHQTRFAEAKLAFERAVKICEAGQQVINDLCFSSVYQLGRTAVLANQYWPESESAFYDYIKDAPVNDDLPSKDWAKYRLAQLFLINAQYGEAKATLAQISHYDDESLDKAIRSLRKKLD